MIDLRPSRTIMRSRSWSSSCRWLESVSKSSELIGSGRSCQIGLVSFGSDRVASHRMHNLMCVEVVQQEIYVDFPYWVIDGNWKRNLRFKQMTCTFWLGVKYDMSPSIGYWPQVKVRNWKAPKHLRYTRPLMIYFPLTYCLSLINCLSFPSQCTW